MQRHALSQLRRDVRENKSGICTVWGENDLDVFAKHFFHPRQDACLCNTETEIFAIDSGVPFKVRM